MHARPRPHGVGDGGRARVRCVAPTAAERSGYDFAVVHDFAPDLAFGQEGEAQAQALVYELAAQPEPAFGQTADGSTIEVKRERWAFHTGLVFCEFGRFGKRVPAYSYCETFERVVDFEASGLAASKAEWVAYLFGDAQVWLPRELVLVKMRAVYARERIAWAASAGRYETDRVRWRVGDKRTPTHGVLLTAQELLCLADGVS